MQELPEWTLLGEVCGSVKTQAEALDGGMASSQEERVWLMDQTSGGRTVKVAVSFVSSDWPMQ